MNDLPTTEQYLEYQRQQLAAMQAWQSHYATCPQCYCSVSRGSAMMHYREQMARSDRLIQQFKAQHFELPTHLIEALHSTSADIMNNAYAHCVKRLGQMRQERKEREERERREREERERKEREERHDPRSFHERFLSWMGIYGEDPQPQGPDTPPDDEPPFKRDERERELVSIR